MMQRLSEGESLCCKPCEKAIAYIAPGVQCITNYDGMTSVVTNPDVLIMSFIQMMMFKKMKGVTPMALDR